MKLFRRLIAAIMTIALASCASDDAGLCGGAYKSEVEMQRTLGGAARPDPNATTVHY
jgi:hypothetical protein